MCLTRKPKPLSLWLDGAGDPWGIELRFDGAVLAGSTTLDPDGVLVRVEPPTAAGRLELSSGGQTWALELRPVTDEFEALRKQVQDRWKAGEALDLAALDEQMASLTADEAALLGCLGARLALAAGDQDGAASLAARMTREGAPTVSCVGRAAQLLAYIQLYLRPDYNAAAQSLAIAESVRGVDLDTRIGAAYLRGVLEHWVGDVDESLLSFERAARLARLVGDDDQYASARVMEAVALARIGRFGEAEALGREVEAQAAKLEHPQLALDLRSSLAWIAVLRREDDPTAPDPRVALREVIGVYAERDDPRNLANRRLDLTLTLVQSGDLDEAATELAQLEPDQLDSDLLVWFELTTARLELAKRRFPRAERHLERAALLAELHQDRELDWRVATTRGELERARGDVDAALVSFAEASEIADGLALAIAGDEGRSRFVTTHSRADLARVELLVASGRDEDAMCAAMAARARHLRGLWARLRPPLSDEAQQRYRSLLSRQQARKQAISARLADSWKLSTAELGRLRAEVAVEGERADQLLTEATALLEHGAPTWSCAASLPQREGEAVLTMAPSLDGRAWTALLAWRADGAVVVASEAVVLDEGGEQDADARARALDRAGAGMLERFAEPLAWVDTLRVIPVGEFVGVDFHALALAGSKPPMVVYSLGLGQTGARPDRIPSKRAAVVAGSKDLAAVGEEAEAVGERLRERGWEVASAWAPGDPEASQPWLLHYAGHAVGAGGPGRLGWSAAIEVPGHGSVSAAQLVAGQRAPELVVLGACSAGRPNPESIDGGMNLAAAFLLAGAELVVAPIRDIDDAAALELGRGLYARLDDDPSADPWALVRALALVQRAQLDADEGVSESQQYTSWRVWVP